MSPQRERSYHINKNETKKQKPIVSKREVIHHTRQRSEKHKKRLIKKQSSLPLKVHSNAQATDIVMPSGKGILGEY